MFVWIFLNFFSKLLFRCFESCPPRTFLPALCRIFLDEEAPDQVLEVTARAITYYLDVSAECTRRIVAVEGAIKAMCNRYVCNMKSMWQKWDGQTKKKLYSNISDDAKLEKLWRPGAKH